MHLQKITSDNFEDIYRILEKTFPKNELQPKIRQKEKFSRSDFYGVMLKGETGIEALLIGYQLPTFLFLEYFAVDASLRGHGLGQKFLQQVLNTADLPVVLEVEPPITKLAQRRVRFYERLGFHLHDYPYKMPDLGNGYGNIPLHLMTYPNALKKEDFEILKQEIYQSVYQVK